MSAKSVDNFWENGVLVTSCHSNLGRKNGQLSKVSGMYDFKVKWANILSNQQALKDATFHILQNGYLGFSKYLVFDYQKPKFGFF